LRPPKDVLDGQQRLRAIFDFMDGKFPTMSVSEYWKVELGPYLPIELRNNYIQFSPQAKNAFDDYSLHLYVLENLDDPIVGMTFRRIQNQVPLTPDEKLWVHTSKATNLAAQLMKHPDLDTAASGRYAPKAAICWESVCDLSRTDAKLSQYDLPASA
jgi:hypothetical protein